VALNHQPPYENVLVLAGKMDGNGKNGKAGHKHHHHHKHHHGHHHHKHRRHSGESNSSGSSKKAEKEKKANPPPYRGKNFKLIVDPVLVKGTKKLYRFEGVVAADSSWNVGSLKDPRSMLTRLWTRLDIMELTVPKFKVSEFSFLVITRVVVGVRTFLN